MVKMEQAVRYHSQVVCKFCGLGRVASQGVKIQPRLDDYVGHNYVCA